MLMTIFKNLWIVILALAYIIWTANIIWLKVKYYTYWGDWLDDAEVRIWLTLHISTVFIASVVCFMIY